jgi:hypothetical protein
VGGGRFRLSRRVDQYHPSDRAVAHGDHELADLERQRETAEGAEIAVRGGEGERSDGEIGDARETLGEHGDQCPAGDLEIRHPPILWPSPEGMT